MVSTRWRPFWFSLAAIVLVWGMAVGAFRIARNSKPTAAKLRAYAQSIHLSELHGEARARAIRRLEEMLNGLTLEERRQARLDRVAREWLEQMTEEEKGQFIEATMPTGFKQMLTAFEQLPEDKKQRSIDDALRRLREARQSGSKNPEGEGGNGGTNSPPLSPELQAKIRAIGLKTFFSESSPQTKAQLAPVLEELQLVMESGRPFRR